MERGVYGFGLIRVFATTMLGLVQRRYSCGTPTDVKVYPSYLQLRQYELLAISNRLRDMGIKRIRRAGNNTEFEQIKDYVAGDEFRTINWKASARRHQLMVNVYQAERSQQVMSLIDKGRVMQRSFRGMTLLDYAINASLVLSYVAIHREDRAGLIAFNERMDTLLPPSNRPSQMERIQESLYAVHTDFGETDYSALVEGVEKHLTNARCSSSIPTSATPRASTASCPTSASWHVGTDCWWSTSRTTSSTNTSPPHPGAWKTTIPMSWPNRWSASSWSS